MTEEEKRHVIINSIMKRTNVNNRTALNIIADDILNGFADVVSRFEPSQAEIEKAAIDLILVGERGAFIYGVQWLINKQKLRQKAKH